MADFVLLGQSASLPKTGNSVSDPQGQTPHGLDAAVWVLGF